MAPHYLPFVAPARSRPSWPHMHALRGPAVAIRGSLAALRGPAVALCLALVFARRRRRRRRRC
eukprot:1172902-Pyramimonas_sp.AAC.1